MCETKRINFYYKHAKMNKIYGITVYATIKHGMHAKKCAETYTKL